MEPATSSVRIKSARSSATAKRGSRRGFEKTLRWLIPTMLIAAVAPLVAKSQSGGESLRDLFIKSRPAQSESESKEEAAKPNIALGYTLLVRSASGRPQRVGSSHRFIEGNRLRVIVEPNRDGFLYIFNREGDGALRMIFPDLRIRRGDARVLAHVPSQIPQGDTDKDWFVISGETTKESLFIVCSIDPVSEWPSGRELLKYPGGFDVSRAQFNKLIRADSSRIVEQSSMNDAAGLTDDEQASISRGLKLLRKDPPPVTIETSASASRHLVVEVEIKRR